MLNRHITVGFYKHLAIGASLHEVKSQSGNEGVQLAPHLGTGTEPQFLVKFYAMLS